VTSLTTLLAIMKHTSRPKNAAVKEINVYIADILYLRYRYRINIGKGDIDPPLVHYRVQWKRAATEKPQRSHMLPLRCHRFTYHIMHGSGTF